ncbi:MAG: GAF domain-containing protein, partial [Nitrospirota bacterium]|nr:GAF domain-containing protein [Nitrospirota bacterium]
VTDIKSDERITTNGRRKYRSSSFICVPVSIKEKTLGVINISDKINNDLFTEDDLETVNILSGQAAISLEHAYLISDLHQMSSELDRVNRTLFDSERLKIEFMAKITHELRTPLNSITGAAYYLKEKKCTREEQEEFVTIISDETIKLISLLQGMLNFSFTESEEQSLKRDAFDIQEIIREATASKTVNDILEKNRVSVNIACPEALPDITGYRIYLVQAIIYLIDGIIKYTKAGDSINITADHTDTSVKIDMFVKERTIPENEMPFIFNERALWSDVDTSRNKLKFYLAKKNVKLHKGSISVYNAREGMTISIAFPINTAEAIDAEINEISEMFLSLTADTIGLKRCSLMLIDETTDEMTIRSAIGLNEEVIRNTRTRIGDNIAGQAALGKAPLLIHDMEKDPRIGKKSSAQYNTNSFLCMPLVINNKVAGVINMSNKMNSKPFNDKDLYLARAITERLSHIIEKIQAGKLKSREFRAIVNNMEALLNAKSTHKKNGDVTDLVYGIAKNMGFSENDAVQALYASSLYDLGMARIDKSILMKKEALSSFEQRIIKTHTLGADLIRHMETDDTVNKGILHHHENYDGSGYPDGLKGEEIPLISRILSVADTYTAMTSDRPYRKAFRNKEAVKEIQAGAGKQFDPLVVEAFTRTV